MDCISNIVGVSKLKLGKLQEYGNKFTEPPKNRSYSIEFGLYSYVLLPFYPHQFVLLGFVVLISMTRRGGGGGLSALLQSKLDKIIIPSVSQTGDDA